MHVWMDSIYSFEAVKLHCQNMIKKMFAAREKAALRNSFCDVTKLPLKTNSLCSDMCVFSEFQNAKPPKPVSGDNIIDTFHNFVLQWTTAEQQRRNTEDLAALSVQFSDKKVSAACTKESLQTLGAPEVRGDSTSCCK